MANSFDSFQDFSLNKQLLEALAAGGYTTPTPIQQKAIPPGLAGHDVMGIAQTGTGKTAAYLLPLLMQLKYAKDTQPRGLVLAPSKELVLQIAAVVTTLTKYMDLRVACLYGGVGHTQQLKTVTQGVDLLVATPGRLLDLYQRGGYQLRGVRYVVLDEADKLLTKGCWPQLQAILELLPRKRQHFLFSATMSAQARSLSESFLVGPTELMITPQATPVATVHQVCYHLPNVATKARLLALLLAQEAAFDRVMVFTRTRKSAMQVANFLTRKVTGEVRVIHANKGQHTRINALQAFRSGAVRVLVATDVVARGIDVSQVSHVVNFEVPHWPEEYVHRIGRTGRAAHLGKALTLVDPSEVYYWHQIERLMRQKVAVEPLPAELEVVATTQEEQQEMARRIDWQRQKEDPNYQGAFHAKKQKNSKRPHKDRRGK